MRQQNDRARCLQLFGGNRGKYDRPRRCHTHEHQIVAPSPIRAPVLPRMEVPEGVRVVEVVSRNSEFHCLRPFIPRRWQYIGKRGDAVTRQGYNVTVQCVRYKMLKPRHCLGFSVSVGNMEDTGHYRERQDYGWSGHKQTLEMRAVTSVASRGTASTDAMRDGLQDGQERVPGSVVRVAFDAVLILTTRSVLSQAAWQQRCGFPRRSRLH